MNETEPRHEAAAPSMRPRLQWEPIVRAMLLPVAAGLCLALARTMDVVLIVTGSALMAAATWVGFVRLPHRLVSAVLMACGVVATLSAPPLWVAWLLAAMAAGAIGARLTWLGAEEDDFFFLPLAAAALVLASLLGLGFGGGWPAAVELAGNLAEPVRAEGEIILAKKFKPEHYRHIMAHFDLYLLTLSTALWGLALWLGGRLARRLLGRLRGLKPALFMFRLHQKYIFLLILGLILEIFSSLALWEAPLSYAAWPLLGVVGAAGFLEGLGIVLFMVQVRRMAGQGRSAGRLALLGALAAVFFWQATMLLGLADYWLDFRRLDRLRRRTDTGARDPQD